MTSRRTRFAVLGAGLAVALVGTGTLGYRWMTSSRPVSASAAVAAYRAHHVATPSPTPAPTAAAVRPARGASSAASVKTAAVARHDAAAAAPMSWWHPPPSGVYTYNTTGWERATFTRSYPSTTQRIIDTSNGSYENHHIFSSEHEEWFTLHPGPKGGEMLKRRMRVTFGPVTVDETVPFNPGLLGVPYPYTLGQTWSGSWKGETSGTYHRTNHRSSDDPRRR